MDLTYGVAGAGDAANLAALSIEVWLNTYAEEGIRRAFSDYVLSEFTAAKFAEQMASDGQTIVKCERGDYLLGYLKLDFDAPCPTLPELTTEIATLYVRAHHARQGIGKGLLAEASHICRARGIERFWLGVYHENEPAIRFYAAQNFQRAGSCYFELEEERHENFVLWREVMPKGGLRASGA